MSAKITMMVVFYFVSVCLVFVMLFVAYYILYLEN